MKLVVVYDTGSLAPSRIAEAAGEIDCELVFAVADSDHGRDMRPMLELLGSVVPADAVTELKAHRPDGIVTFSEQQLVPTVGLAQALDLPYHSAADIEAITRKDRQRARFAEAGLDAIRFRTLASADQVDEAIGHVGLPAIIKPVLGAGSRNTTVVRTPDACRAWVTEALLTEDSVLLEEFLVGRPTDEPWGDYIAVDCVATGDLVRPVFVTSKFSVAEPFRERGGYGGRSVVPPDEVRAIEELACRAVHALGIRRGVADVEIKLTPSGPRVIEVNGRLGAWVDDLAVRSSTSDPAAVAVRSAVDVAFDLEPRYDGPIAFNYLVIPPLSAKRVRSLHGVARLRRTRDVDRVMVLSTPGTSVDWRLGTRSHVASVSGHVDSHDRLAEAIATIEEVDWVGYE
ncbi:ATP-grasp domain-containing protein [Saccharothrix luteola]|uniref:ATP-grasp domain-containing protein n=1 Tax=Saccharothrix luteola TaxID=2893018 RepID=UPI001E5586DC|nr:ATP-grasp domain-containing protein [Saccharothrix luteola]MCC8242814.1 ATP-grasp domain-containing protein [Saccharothrix luteola]